MRRSTPGVEAVAVRSQYMAGLVARLSDEEVAARVAVLEPLATEARRTRLRSVIAKRVGSVTLVLDAPHDPHNGAAVLRSCDVFGLTRIHVVERRQTFLASRTVSRGSEQWVDVATYANAPSAADRLLSEGFELIATHPSGTLAPRDLASRGRIALVLGNEHDGIGRDLTTRCADAVSIPMRGYAESLNVSVTAAILLFEATAQRPGDLSDSEQLRLYLRGLLDTVPRSRDVLAARELPMNDGETRLAHDLRSA
ncbi:MAG: RNA methyltransferase [Polyangiaceae bacterium]